jgi:hypothetical protein
MKRIVPVSVALLGGRRPSRTLSPPQRLDPRAVKNSSVQAQIAAADEATGNRSYHRAWEPADDRWRSWTKGANPDSALATKQGKTAADVADLLLREAPPESSANCPLRRLDDHRLRTVDATGYPRTHGFGYAVRRSRARSDDSRGRPLGTSTLHLRATRCRDRSSRQISLPGQEEFSPGSPRRSQTTLGDVCAIR